MNVAKQFRIFVLGIVGVAAAMAGLVAWLGMDTLADYQDDLLYFTQQHLMLVGNSMVLAIATGIPAGIALSRPCCARYAERFMQVFNIGNTLP
jgi:osmoprotectant transport system permease protein